MSRRGTQHKRRIKIEETMAIHPLLMLIAAVTAVCTAAPTSMTPPMESATPTSMLVTLHTYYAIDSELNELRRTQKTAYDNYKMDRFHDEDIYISSTMVNIAGMPDLSGLTNADRFAMNESDLLQLHGSNLQIFRNLMFFVEADEALSNSPINFGNNFSTIRVRLNRVVAMLEAVMEQRDFFQTGFPTPPGVYLQPNGNELERNTRDLFVLQEMHSYLHVAHYDLYTWYSRHLYNYHASQ